MDFSAVLLGAVIGFLVAAPVGPVAVLCIQRTLADDRGVGYSTGLGAAIADTVFGALAIFSVAFVQSFLSDHHDLVRLVGGVVLVIMGAWGIFGRKKVRRSEEAAQRPRVDHATLLQAFASAFIVTILNPITILAFISIFATVGVSVKTEGLIDSWILIFGVFIGALFWWGLLVSITAIFRQRFTDKGLRWLNRLSGLLILGFGVYALGLAIWSLGHEVF
jgi:threonine/homoserine/homoserine lactone efflux protein